MAKCSNNTCSRPGTHGLEVRVWAKGRPKTPGTHASLYMPLPLCLPCALAVKAEEFFTDESWARIESAMLAAGHMPPDRRTAEITPALIDPLNSMMTAASKSPNTFVYDPKRSMH